MSKRGKVSPTVASVERKIREICIQKLGSGECGEISFILT
jgi:hypothetical protein